MTVVAVRRVNWTLRLLAIFVAGSKSRSCENAENAKLAPAAAGSKPQPQKLNLDAAGQVLSF